jgi:hypothetical protein
MLQIAYPIPRSILKTAVKALETRQHENVVKGLLFQLAAPVPGRCQAA